MTWIALLVLAAAAAFVTAQWLRLPIIPLLILFGFALGNSGISVESAALDNALDLGLAFLLFTAGLELSPRRFQRYGSAVLWVGLVQFFTVGLAGLALAHLMGFRGTAAVFLALSLATSSTLVVVRRLQTLPGSLGSYGRLVIGVLLLQDVLMIVLMVTLGNVPDGWEAVMHGLLGLGGLIALAVVIQQFVAPTTVRRTRLDEEAWLLVTLSLLFIFAGLASLLGLPPLAGAFLAGFSLSAFPIGGLVRALLGSLRTFFLAVFFTALGAKIGLPSLSILFKALACVGLVLVITPVLVTAMAEWKAGLSSRKAISSGLLLAQTSEFALVIGLFGLKEAQIPEEVFSIIALVAVISMTLTPFLSTDGVARRLLRWHPLRHRLQTASHLKNHVLMLGFGSSGTWTAKPLLAAGHHLVVVDHDPATIDHLEGEGIECIRGDAADEKILDRAGAMEAKIILTSLSEIPDALNVIRHVKGVPVIVRVFEEADAKRIEAAGGTPILNSLAAADSFMEWIETLPAESPST